LSPNDFLETITLLSVSYSVNPVLFNHYRDGLEEYVMQRGGFEIYDVTVGISQDTVIWPGDPDFKLTFAKLLSEGASSNVSQISLGSHTATHVDAPRHFIDGAATVDEIPLETLIGPARVLDMRAMNEITARDLEAAGIGGAERLLFKTDNSQLWKDMAFTEEFTWLDETAAKYVVETGVKLVGVDYLGVEKPHVSGHPVHTTLLSHGVVIIEGLDLSKAPAGDYELICLPLKVVGAEAAPARVILRRLST